MAKEKENPKNEELKEIPDEIPQIPDEETPKAGRDKPEVYKTYHKTLWAGKLPVFICDHCGLQRDDEGRMILHVIGHFPDKERQKVFDYLVKDK